MRKHLADDSTGPILDPHLARKLLAYAKPYRVPIAWSVFTLLLMAMIQGYLPVLIKKAIDDYITATSAEINASIRIQGITHVAWIFISLSGAVFLLRSGQGYLMSWIGQRIIADLRMDLFRKLMRMPLKFMDRTPVGRLMTRMSSDIEAMERAVSDGLIGLIADLFTLLGVMGFMLFLSWRLALILFLLLPFLFVGIVLLNTQIRSAHRNVRKQQSTLNTLLQEAITGMLTIQLFSREENMHARFGEHNHTLKDAWIRSVYWFSCFFPTMEVFRALSFSLLLIAGGAAIGFGIKGVSIGVLIAFFAYVREFYRPLEDLSDKSNILQSAMASSERIFGLLETPEEIEDPVSPKELDHFKGLIEFENVTFAYEGEDWVLRDLSFVIKPGEAVALVGATGAGKSSVASLIARFYDVQKGRVKVDGVDVRDYRQADLRQRVGIVLQDPFIFSGSVASNISMNDPDISRERVIESAKYVNADSFIRELPEGYDTELSERGATISTGQKQLLALARALAQNPDILLILDEATASVDTETELLIQDALKKLMKSRTSILIAHRLSTIRDVGRIFVMRRGKIIEEGTHAELIQKEGYYKTLYELLGSDRNIT
ncbi:MAG: ABC transporter ATP-binding protein/permease [Verrucomicrobia bacterium]|nr:ABC transporter ATP-binding protein/permease [Verrucomicrobiota bacterium]